MKHLLLRRCVVAPAAHPGAAAGGGLGAPSLSACATAGGSVGNHENGLHDQRLADLDTATTPDGSVDSAGDSVSWCDQRGRDHHADVARRAADGAFARSDGSERGRYRGADAARRARGRRIRAMRRTGISRRAPAAPIIGTDDAR